MTGKRRGSCFSRRSSHRRLPVRLPKCVAEESDCPPTMAASASDLAALSRLLDESMPMTPAQREMWLGALPAEVRHLGPMLQELLAEHMATGRKKLLSTLPNLAQPDPTLLPRAGELVGPYRLVREVGHGGMGTVWLAERADGSFKRQVALKLPRLSWGAGLVERMVREREIGALLEHPNIARLYDAGVDGQGRPYIALEYISGKAIDVWCDEKGLGLSERLQLFLQVVRAVAYAHGHLVVHRDIKPSNILVSEDGQVHLLDFGIAKLLSESDGVSELPTQELGRALTPLYASPEQMLGAPITVASDVYSLGVLLYKLLTDRHPYQAGSLSQLALEEAVLRGDTVLASERARDKRTARALRGELDSILSKSLNRDPRRRYTTADGLAQDIESYLRGEPVLARGDSTAYRLVKAVKRHRAAFATSGLVLLAVVGGTAASLLQARRASDAAERARVVKEFVVEVFRINERSSRSNAELRQLPAELLLERGASLIETKFPGQPHLQAELFGVVGGIFADMGASHTAAEYALRHVNALESVNAEGDERARANFLLAKALIAQGRLTDAEAAVQRALNIPRLDKRLAGQARVLLAHIWIELGRHDQAFNALDEFDRQASKPAANAQRARSHALRAKLLALAGDIDGALPLYQSAIAEAIAAEGDASPVAIDIRLEVSKYLLGHMRAQESIEYGDAALGALRSSGSAGAIRALLEEARLTRRRYRSGAILHSKAAEVFERLQTEVHGRGASVPKAIRAAVDFEFGSTQLLWGEVASAYELLSRSSSTVWEVDESWDARASLAAYRGDAAMRTGRHQEADTHLRESLRYAAAGRGMTNPMVVYAYVYVAINLDMQGRYNDARAVLLSAPNFREVAGFRAALYPSNEIKSAMARIELDRGYPELALAALPPQVQDQSDNVFMYSDQTQLRGEILCANGRLTEGLELMKRAIGKHESEDIYPYEPELARARAVAGLCAFSAKRQELARRLAALARVAFRIQPDVSPYFKEPSLKLDKQLGFRESP